MPTILTTPLPSNPNSVVSRRHFLIGTGVLTLAGLGTRAQALSVDDAKSLILKVTGEVQAIINSGRSESAMINDFAGIFQRYADVPRIAATLLGPPWRTAGPGEKSAYVTALSGYLARKYGRQFREFVGAQITLTKATDLGRKGVIVASTVKTDVFEPFPVEWHVIEAGGRQTFFDIIIEGVRLLATERSEIRAILDRTDGSVASLASALNKMG